MKSSRKSKKINGRLGTKIFLTLLLVSIVPLLFLGVLALYSLNLFHQADVESIENNLLNQKRAEAVEFFDRVVETFQLQVGFDQVADIEPAQQVFLLDGYMRDIPALESISFISLSGQETSGRDRSGPHPAEELLDYSRMDKFRQAVSGENYLSPVHFTLSGPEVSIATPVRNRNGAVIAVLTGEVNLSELQSNLARSYLGESGYVYLVDKSGALVAHSKSERLDGVGVDRPNSSKSLRYKSFWNEDVAGLRKSVGKLDLTLVAEWPVQEADGVVSVVRGQMLMFSAIIALIALVASWFLTYRIVRPVRALEKSTELVAQGKFDKPVEIKTGDELEALGLAFNKMQEGLKELEQLKEEFVFIAAHELRTPVTAIKGYLSMITGGEAGEVSAEAREMITQVAGANARLIQLVEDLLQVARSEAGRLTISVAPLDVVLLTRSVLAELKPLADEKGIVMSYEPGSVPKILADNDRLKEVFVNLVGNAIKYTLGSGTVTITHEVRGKELITKIRDKGIGIPPEAQKRLFEKFYRVTSKQTKNISGTGLGLFIVRQLVEKMNGRIWVESRLGEGSVFSFSLPIA